MQRFTPGSAMDVSRDADTPIDEENASPTFPSKSASKSAAHSKLGYQGWAARHLVLACHRIFYSENEGARDDLVSVSLEHRGVIYWCLSNINADLGPSSSSAASEADFQDEDVFHDGLTDFYHVWTLAEAFLLDSAPLPAAPLLRWLKMYSQSGEDEAARWELDEAERIALEADAHGNLTELTPTYWSALQSLVVGVMPRRAAELLRCHPEGRDNAGEVGAIARQLEKMPLLLPERAEGGGVGAEAQLDREGFFETWTRWQKGCKATAASFGVVAGAGGDLGRGGDGFGAGDGDERRHLQWLWGTLCGSRSCLEEATDAWAGLFAAVLAFERPDVRKEEVASVMRDCARKHPPHQEEDFLLKVIRDASAGAVEAVLRFAREHGDTLALSACAAHLVDLLFRAELPSVTNAQRAWFFRRLADRLKAFPCGGWELASAYIGAAGAGDAELLRDLTRAVVPGSERAAHELVEWCRLNGLGREVAATVCRARGVAWLAKTGFSAAAMGTVREQEEERCENVGAQAARVPGACGKAAYWLAKGEGVVRLERLCAEVSERLMVDVGPDSAGDLEAQREALAEAEGVLAAIPSGVAGPELSFMERYKDIADLLYAQAEERSQSMDDSRGHHARLAGTLAVDALAPRDDTVNLVPTSPASAAASSPILHPAPSRSWGHLLRLALPALKASVAAVEGGSGGAPGALLESDVGPTVTAPQVHALLAKVQALVASDYRVGCQGGNRASTLSSAPAPYGFRGGKEELLEIRRALASCLATAMIVQNAEERAPEGKGTGEEGAWGAERLPAAALIAPRVAV